MNSPSNIQKVAAFFVSRAAAQGMKGAARDRAAIEFVTGAAAAAAAIHGEKSPEWAQLSGLAFIVSIRGGYRELERIAKGEVKS